MKYEIQERFKDVYKFLSNRLLILFVGFCVAFYAICAGLFDIQIVNGHLYAQSSEKERISRTIAISAPRGEIYDRYGRPLAVNQTEFSIKIDPSVTPDGQMEILLRFIELAERNGESIANVVAAFPITETEPREFDFTGTGTREERWKEDMGVKADATAENAYKHLSDYFGAPEGLEDDTLYTLLALRSAIFMNRYNLNPIAVAVGVKEETVAVIEEQNHDYTGFYTDVDYLRYYPEGGIVSHIVGYLGSITSEEYEAYEDLGYSLSDIVGRAGIENSFELQLRGTDGTKIVYANSDGRRVGSEDEIDPVQGDSVYLTIDIDLQRETYSILEEMLTEILLGRLSTPAADEYISAAALLSSMMTTNNVSIKDILAADDGASLIARRFIEENAALDPENKNYADDAKAFAGTAIADGDISADTMIAVLHEQDIITMTEEDYAKALGGSIAEQNYLTSKVTEGEITPQMTGLEPCTGTLVVTDVRTGEVLAAPNYPTYDNNQFVNARNSAYIAQLNSDPTSPQINRAFSSPRAPGSTFKMITALAGLEEGIISTATKIYDHGTFTDAGSPYASCMIARRGGSHGSINVSSALSVSCNYFFFQTSWLMGDTTAKRIEVMNKYMSMFGLNGSTGVEISEYNPTPEGTKRISSPEYKEYVLMQRAAANGTSVTSRDLVWTDGETIRTAIGQADNNYTAATMAKYIATLANGGTRYQMSLLDKITADDGSLVKEQEPVVETVLAFAPENLEAVYEGMRAVTQSGTAKSVFADFSMEIAGKTGTTEQDMGVTDHSSFACYAPYDDPQIAVYVVIPYGNTSVVSSCAAKVAKSVLTAYFGLDNEPESSSRANTLVE